mmetsp:Transcript_15296/g.25427  ORF Transcript_15296/g.25427 Transcript_15296/m.25427 type:complete len:86 (+) Transcript_15296:2204-2461(+)
MNHDASSGALPLLDMAEKLRCAGKSLDSAAGVCIMTEGGPNVCAFEAGLEVTQGVSTPEYFRWEAGVAHKPLVGPRLRAASVYAG